MLTVDFHTHIFPDKIAKTSIGLLAKASGTTPYLNGTKDGLKEGLIQAGVSLAVALPVLTKPTQFESVLNYATSVNKEFNLANKANILSFAGIHPDCENLEDKIKLIKEFGFLGVKIHPDYQGVFIDDERYYKIVKLAKDNDLIVVTHSGIDDGFLNAPIRCAPQCAVKLLDRLGGYDKFVFAHLGANRMFDETLKYLAGKSVYFDTGYSLNQISDSQFRTLVLRHGTNKILFASDSPWADIGDFRERILAMDLSPLDKELILYKNALKLLNLENYYDK